jgi:hypothetical protein
MLLLLYLLLSFLVISIDSEDQCLNTVLFDFGCYLGQHFNAKINMINHITNRVGIKIDLSLCFEVDGNFSG